MRFLPTSVMTIGRDAGGLFGIRNSPSLPSGFPDARELRLEALDGSGRRFALRVPRACLPQGTAAGQRIVLGLNREGRVISLLDPDVSIPTEDLAHWAARHAGTSR